MTAGVNRTNPDRWGTNRTWLVVAGVCLLIAGLPLALWLDLRNLSDDALQLQATEMAVVIDTIRSHYASAIVARVKANPQGKTAVVHNYQEIPGAIPIPATLSIELGQLLSDNHSSMKYGFLSDYPFKNRTAHHLDPFETNAIKTFRSSPEANVHELTCSLFDRKIRVATPILMGQACVSCHNTHPESPKTDWKLDDVRGIQTVEVNLPISKNIFAFKYLLLYMLFALIVGVSFIYLQKRQTAIIRSMNGELTKSNDFLAGMSISLAKYLSPQVYKSIFSGEKEVVVSTERKKLTIFFSDIKDFTDTTERLQPEEITELLNEYLTEMSNIALKHGATIDKYIGDAILVFFGDPQTKGVKEDARACLRMALEMQTKLVEMNARWRKRGSSAPSRCGWASIPGSATSGTLAATSEWITRSSAPKPISPPACKPPPSPAAS